MARVSPEDTAFFVGSFNRKLLSKRVLIVDVLGDSS